MIDLKTLHFLEMIQELAEATAAGFLPFSKAKNDNFRGITYNDCMGTRRNSYRVEYPVVLASIFGQSILNGESLEITVPYDDYVPEEKYTVRAVCENDNWWVEIAIENESKKLIIVEDGKWFFA